MTIYKGRPDARTIKRDFPYGVVMPVPIDGFGARFDLMHRWHTAAGLESQQGRGSLQGKRYSICWYFSDAAVADKFQAEFGGARQNF